MDSRRLQSHYNGIENDDKIELPSSQIRKMQNTADVRITILTKVVIGRKELDISIREVSGIIG